jgi:TetR/AcrR family transcriptional repressor of nem operon
MTDLAEQQQPGKRERLVASAAELLHRQGVEATTLAEIAQAADVPPGNVYYYFKTRDDLVRAVIERQATHARALLDSLAQHRTPAARLKGLLRSWTEVSELVAEHGCPMGSLCSELNKHNDGLDQQAAQVLALPIDWAQAQFRQMGHKDARDLAITLFAGIQGAALLANTLRDPEIMTRQTRRLERWIDTLAQANGASRSRKAQ